MFTIIFDLGGVYFTEGTKITVAKISKKFKLDAKNVEDFLKTSNKLADSYRKGNIPADEFWNNFCEKFKINAKNQELTKMWVEAYEPIKGTINLISKLHKKGCKIYFLSDNVKERVEYLQKKYNFLENFIGGIFSHEVHKTKLDGVAIFQLALNKVKEKPENVIYIDDKEEYVKYAEKLGMRGICFKNPQQLEADLKLIGVFKE